MKKQPKAKDPRVLDNQMVVKRPKHRLRRFFKTAPRLFKWGFAVLAILVVGYLIWWGLGKSSYFTIQKVEVVGDLKELNMDTILKLSKVKTGTNLFKLSLKDVEENVLKEPWIESVSVRRQAPSTLWIYVKEQKPVALLLTDKLYFVSNSGFVFKAVEQESCRDLPVLTGFAKNSSLDEAVKILHFLESSSDFEMFGLSEIHYNVATGYSVVTLLGPMEVKLGREGFEAKLHRLKNIWSQAGDKLGRVRGIDLDYSDRAFVKL